MKVMIKRSDGRIHPAIIANFNLETHSVTVEWFENGETKGKDIDFETLCNLNPQCKDLLKSNDHCAPSISNSLLNTGIARSGTRSSVPQRIDSRVTNIIPPSHNQNGHYGRENMYNIMEHPTSGPKSSEMELPVSTNTGLSRLAQTAAMNQDSSSIKSRKSHTVKEVEKLKHNREVRRQKQAEKKEEKEAMMSVDPGNPNWQFLAMIREYQSSIEMRPLKETDPVDTHQITVCVRKRPLNKKECNKKEIDVISVPRKDVIIVHEPKNKVDLTKYLDNLQFRFDYAFDESCSNEMVYKYTAKPLVQTIFEGGMATCFAYGQTGSGKTHTMGGTFTGKSQNCNNGIYAMVAKDVFKYLVSPNYRHLKFAITASFFEIYSGKVFDLLAEKAKLRVLEDGKQQVQVVGLTEKVVSSVNEVLALIQAGNQERTAGQTSANSNSSRSHAVFQITLRVNAKEIFGKFSLIDLAGNERGADTCSADRQTRMEGAEINKSLLALKECIRALGVKGRAHLPFRASKLTQVLRDSFIGENSRTCMIAMISPGMNSCEHTLNTLRYANRVKELACTDPALDTAMDTQEDNGQTTDREDDLAALRSLNEHEISADLYNFHEAISQLQQVEEDVLDRLKTWIDLNHQFSQQEHALLSMTREVDFDQEAFANRLSLIWSQRLEAMEPLREKIPLLNNLLREEEEISRKIKK